MTTGIEKLNRAAKAAGFAMVASDEDYAPAPRNVRHAPLEAPVARAVEPKAEAWRPTSRALQPAGPRVVVRGSLVRHWLAGWAGRTATS